MSTKKSRRYGYVEETLTEQAEIKKQPHQESIGQTEEIEVLAIPAIKALQNPSAFALPAQRRGRRKEDGVIKRTDIPREQLNVRIRPELKRAASGLAGLRGMTLGDVVEAALIEYLRAAQADLK